MNYQKSKQCCNIRSSFSLLFIILFSGILFANNPKKKKISDEMKLSGVALITSDTVEVHNGSIVTLPIRITSSQILGAVSLIINYTDNLIQINAVNSPVMSGMITNVANSKIYLAWNNFQGINLAANDILLNIEIQVTTDDIASIDFSLDPNCELADINANVLNGIQLSIPELVDDSSIITNVQLAICSNDSIFVGGAWQNTAGTYYDTLQTTQALDSIIITILTINLSDTSYRQIIFCGGDSVYVGGGWQYYNGIFTDYFINQHGCDSIVITEISEEIFDCFMTTVNICQGQSYYTGGAFQTQGGIYWNNITSPAGCSYYCATNLIVNPVPVVDIGPAIDTLCWQYQDLYTILDAGNPGASYLWSTGETTQQVEIWGEELGTGGWSTVSVTVTQGNCSASDSVLFWVDICEGMSSAEQSRSAPLLFPSPTSGLFSITCPIHSIISIMDITGKELLYVKAKSIETSFDLRDYASGTYFVKIISSGNASHLKLVLRK